MQRITDDLNNADFYVKVKEKKDLILKKFVAYNKKCKSLYSHTFSFMHQNDFSFLFLTPKFHKNPVKFRPICCTSKSIVKNYSVHLQLLLKKIYDFLKFKFKNSSYFWSIDNSLEVINNIHIKPTTVQVFDFENLFNNIPIDLLYNVLRDIFDLFSIGEELKINREFFLSLCHFCFYNNFVTFGNDTYRQICGIGMGTNYSSTAANLFLFYYEYKYIVKYNCKLNIFRYVDDFLIFNHDFCADIKQIYPDCLNLNKANSNDFYADFLDISFKILNNELILDLFDKRNSFNFFTISMPHWYTNINKKVFINVIISQLVRYKKICNNNFNLNKQIFKFAANLFYNNLFPYNFIYFYIGIFLKSIGE